MNIDAGEAMEICRMAEAAYSEGQYVAVALLARIEAEFPGTVPEHMKHLLVSA